MQISSGDNTETKSGSLQDRQVLAGKRGLSSV